MKNIPSLHTMTEYSFLESTIKVDELINFAQKHDLKALAMTDHNNMFGVGEFINKTKKANIKPIIGIDLDVEKWRFIVLAKNYDGFKLLLKLASKKGYQKEVKIKMIDSKDLIVIDHPLVSYMQDHENEPQIKNFYTVSGNFANTIKVNFTRMLDQEDLAGLETVDQLSDKTYSSTASHFYQMENYSLAEVNAIQEIIDSIDIVFPKNINPIPRFDAKQDSNLLLKSIINKNAKQILQDKQQNPEYIKRIKYEFSIIEKLKFEDYFLIIWDLLKWARENDIIIGPGRGSSAGSIIAYLLNITEIDPIENKLLFERFLNPERITMPDIDIDIQDNKREQVVDYLFKKYGAKNTALISTFQRLGAKSSIRDIGRMMGFANGDMIVLTKLIPNFSTLKEAFKSSARFRAAIEKTSEYTKLFEIAKKVEGLPRQMGTHAAGVVVANQEISNLAPVILSSDNKNQTQYSMDYLEENGLLKIDLLGLKNLTILKDIKKEIKNNFNRNVALHKIPYDDDKTNKVLSSGNTNGIFQLESYGMKKTLKQVKVSSMHDLAIIISLYRPGPMEYINVFADRKNKNQNYEKVNKSYDQILAKTHGIIVYQEQIMEIAQVFAGMTFGKADILRRAISKKKIKQIISLKQAFIDGAIKNGHQAELANKIYSNIERFADYGFNKSHAYAYGVLAYRMAYLKAWFPFEFYVALMKSYVHSLSTMKQYIFEAKAQNIDVVAPHINLSQENIYHKKPKIFLPLSTIKGLGEVANHKIISERDKNGAYKDFFELVARVKKHSISEAIITAMIKGNALRDFGNMNTLLNSLPQALRYAAMIITDKDQEKLDFSYLPKPKIINFDQDIKLEEKYEQEIYGFNISVFKTINYELAKKIIDIEEKGAETVVAEVAAIKQITDKNNETMGIIVLKDSSTTIEVFAFHRVFEFIKNDKQKIVKAHIKQNNGGYVLTRQWEVVDAK